MRKVLVAATQMACSWDREATLAKAEKLVREAAAKELDIVIPVSFFERTGNVAFNSVVIIDADGCLPVLL